MTGFSFADFILHLASAAALLLWSVRLVRTGVERAFGRHLRAWMTRSANRRPIAAMSGLVAALAMQSSTAVLALIAGFASAQALPTVAGLSVLLGADFGSALVVRVMALNTAAAMPILMFAGVLLFLRGASREVRQTGRILIGLALVFISLKLIREAAQPLIANGGVGGAFDILAHDLVSAFLIGAGLTWLIHSSVAAVLLIVTLTAEGLLAPEAALATVLGANLGSCLIAIGLTLRAPEATRVIVIGNLILRGGGAVVGLLLLRFGGMSGAFSSIDGAQSGLDLHLLFNGCVLLFGLPSVPLALRAARQVSRMFVTTTEDLDEPNLDPDMANRDPQRALARARQELMRLGQSVERLHAETIPLLFSWNSATAEAVTRQAERVRARHEALKRFLAQIPRTGLDESSVSEIEDIILYGSNIEAAANALGGDLLTVAMSVATEGLRFSAPGEADIRAFADEVGTRIEAALMVLLSRDLDAARSLIAHKDELRRLERDLHQRHFARLSLGQPETLSTSRHHQEALRSIKQVNSCFAAIPTTYLERNGAMLTSRLAPG